MSDQYYHMPHAWFLVLLRFCEGPLVALMRNYQNVFHTGVLAMIRYLTPDNLLWVFGHLYVFGRNLTFNLFVPKEQSYAFASALADTLNDELKPSFVQGTNCFVYMLEMLCRNHSMHYTILEPDHSIPQAIFFVQHEADANSASVYLRTKKIKDANDTRVHAFHVFEVRELGEEAWSLQFGDSQGKIGLTQQRYTGETRYISRDHLMAEWARKGLAIDLLRDTLRTSKKDWVDSDRVLAMQEASQVDMPEEEHIRIAQIHATSLEQSPVNLTPSHNALCRNTLADAVAAYSSVDCSLYMKACIVAKYRGWDKPVGNYLHQRLPKGGTPFYKITDSVRCAATLCAKLDSDRPLHVTDRQRSATSFTVYRGVDYFQPLGEDSKSVFDMDLPFTIRNFTVSSTSVGFKQSYAFVQHFRSMLILDVPFSYRRYIALGNGLSMCPHELEILFPDDVEFEITHRAMELQPNDDRPMLKLIGRVKGESEAKAARTDACTGDLLCSLQGGSSTSVMASSAMRTRTAMSTRMGMGMGMATRKGTRMQMRPQTSVSASVSQTTEGETGRVLTLIDLSMFLRPTPSGDENRGKVILRDTLMEMLGLDNASQQIAGGLGKRERTDKKKKKKKNKSKGPLKIELSRLAATLGIRGFSRMRKAELAKAIQKHRRTAAARLS